MKEIQSKDGVREKNKGKYWHIKKCTSLCVCELFRFGGSLAIIVLLEIECKESRKTKKEKKNVDK